VKTFLIKYAHWIVFGVAAIWTVLETLPPSTKSGQMDLGKFGRLPVEESGRIKPFDTLARISLLHISNQQEFKDTEDRKQPAIRWLLDVMSAPDPKSGPAAQYKVFRIENDQVLEFLGLPLRPGSFRYSYAELVPSRVKLQEAYEQAEEKRESKSKSLFETKILELGDRLARYEALSEHATPAVVPPQAKDGQWLSLLRVDRAVIERYLRPVSDRAEEHVRQHLIEGMRKDGLDPEKLKPEEQEAFERLVRRETIQVLRAVMEQKRAEVFPAADAFTRILNAYRDGDARRFHEAVADYRAKFFDQIPEVDIDRAGFEAFLNRFTPFYFCAVMYICVFLLAAMSWLYWPDTLRRAAFWLGVLTLALHTSALLGRMYLMDRPLVFVTNLYSSAVFIAWGCAGIGLILEAIYRNSVGVAVGAILGAVSNLIGHNLLVDGDTLATLQPVLDTNPWLASHVTCVTLGYVATLLAGGLGAAYIIAGVFTPALDRARAKTLSSMLYGVLCFATFLSFTGTVLGGIWADQSWGRFWGWDPKENGAVLVVIWNVLVLHARWAGIVKQRGIAVLSLVGFMITFWSWFGTNQLGVGLHAYGFSNKLAVLCLVCWGVGLLLLSIGLVPLRYWRSFRAQSAKLPSPAAQRAFKKPVAQTSS
jgi:ABC-type transport system involved in cytochrome c biogenesis permease subunit